MRPAFSLAVTPPIPAAIRSVRPYGIDVSSGVESSPGIKDPNRLRSFFEALHD
jgi:phosphoribosylanthranilate isomerase